MARQPRITSSKEMLIAKAGIYDVWAYERVKRLSMVIGNEMARALIEHVGGRVVPLGGGCDGETRLGRWEFTLSKNAKNKDGGAANLARCPDRCVQIFGTPNPGWMSGQRFLELHGANPEALQTLASQVLERVEYGTSQLRMAI